MEAPYMKKSRFLILLGLILCLLLTACAAFAEGEAPAETAGTFEVNGFTLERLGNETSDCRIISAADDKIMNGILILPEKLGDNVNLIGYAPSVITENVRIVLVPWNYDIWMKEEEAPDRKIEYFVITYKNFKNLSDSEMDKLPDIQNGEYALVDFYREVISRNGNANRNWNDQDLLLAEDIPEDIYGAKAYNLIDSSKISKQEGDWIYIIRNNSRLGDYACLLSYIGAVEKNFIIPDKLGDLPVGEYAFAVIPDGVEYVYYPENCSTRYGSGEQLEKPIEYYGIGYISYESAAEDQPDYIQRDSTFTEGTYAATSINRWVYKGNDYNCNSVDQQIPADSLLAEINGNPLSLRNLSRALYFADGDWQYYFDGNEDRIDLVGYTGPADSTLIVPETVAGYLVDDIYLYGIPAGVEKVYLPYNVNLSSSRSSFGANESRTVTVIKYISYENAANYYSSLYEDPSFTEGSYAGVDIDQYTYSASGSSYSNSNAYFPADSFPAEINGKPFHLCNISNYATYTDGEYTYALSRDGSELYLINGVPTDKENVLFVPSYVAGKKVRYLSLSELPESITEIFLPSNAYFYRSDFKHAQDINLYYYIDYEMTQDENGWYQNYGILPGELMLVSANCVKVGGNSDKLVQDYYAYPTEINGIQLRRNLSKDYIETYTSGNYTYYKMSETEICICEFADKDARKVNIPETIDGLTVTAISSLNSSRVFDVPYAEEITLPSTLKILGNYALYASNSKKLKTITLPDGLKEIGSYALNLYRLKDITLPDSLERLGSYAFYNTNIGKITIPGSVKVIPSNVCYACYYLAAVTLSEGTTTIADEAFAGRTRLKSINIPASVTSIGKNAFNGCSKLGKVTFAGTGITRIEDCTFVDCKSLSKLDLPEGIESIGYQAFYGTKLGQLNFPSTLKSIESAAFGSCKGIAKITGGTGLESVADDAFQDCSTKLTFIVSEGSFLKQWAESKGFKTKPAK